MQFAAKDFQLGAAVFAGAGVGDGPAQRLGHGLKPVTDAEHRHPEVEQRRVDLGRAVGVDAGRPTGEHQRHWVAGLDVLGRGGVRNDLGENPRLADPTGDQLRVLRAEVHDEHRTSGRSGRARRLGCLDFPGFGHAGESNGRLRRRRPRGPRRKRGA